MNQKMMALCVIFAMIASFTLTLANFTDDLPTDADVAKYEAQSGKEQKVSRGAIVYLVIIIMSFAGLYIFFSIMQKVADMIRKTVKG